MSDAAYPRMPGGASPEPYGGDKVYVGLDILFFLINAGWSWALMPARIDEAMKRMAEQPNGANVSREMIATWSMVGTGGCMCIGLVIGIFLWLNVIKGKKWAFIVTLVFLLLGLLASAMGLSGVGMPLAIFGLVTSAGRVVYVLMRMLGRVGPALS